VGELALPWEAELPYANFSLRLRHVASLRSTVRARVRVRFKVRARARARVRDRVKVRLTLTLNLNPSPNPNQLAAAAPRLAELRRALQPARRAFLWSDASELGPGWG